MLTFFDYWVIVSASITAKILWLTVEGFVTGIIDGFKQGLDKKDK